MRTAGKKSAAVGSRSPERARQRILLATALEMARLANLALARAGLDEATVVGDTRRGVEIVSELQMIVRGPCDVAAAARALRGASACEGVEVVDDETLRMSFEGGGPARLVVVPPASFVEAMLRRTGSPSHVRWLATLAGQGGLTAVCRRSRSEEEVYAALGVPFAPPELREGATRRVPELIAGVHGVFHVHTTWSDGAATILDMGRAAQEAGYAYLGITEHSKA
ncbi:MAG: hypothetical protein ACRELB_09125, partial [Polyangiaceae bacterium]